MMLLVIEVADGGLLECSAVECGAVTRFLREMVDAPPKDRM